MRRVKYDDDFKLEVIKAYLESPHGVRVVARSQKKLREMSPITYREHFS